MADAATAFPLSWPAAWPRTPASVRREARFRSGGGPNRTAVSTRVNLVDARSRLADELEQLGARDIVLSTNYVVRLDGGIRAGQAEPADPGIAVYFRHKGKPVVFACDRWKTVAENVAAVAAHIAAMRGMERWGVGRAEQLFAGYTALPPPIAPGDWRAELGSPATLGEAEAAYRERIRSAHPDAPGGSTARAAALNAAIAEARKVLR